MNGVKWCEYLVHFKIISPTSRYINRMYQRCRSKNTLSALNIFQIPEMRLFYVFQKFETKLINSSKIVWKK